MKSFSRIYTNTSKANTVSWTPPELETAISVDKRDVQKEQLIAFFGNAEDINVNIKRSGCHSALRPTGINQNFAAWQPSAMNLQPAVVRKPEWSFLEMFETPSDKQEEDQITNFMPGETTQPENHDAENEVSMILEHARIQAEEMILAAQAEADNVLLQAQVEIEEQKKEGYQQGRSEAGLEFEDALKAVRCMVEEVNEWKTALMSQGEQILVEMLKEISRKMFGDGVEMDKNALQTNLNRIMESAHGLGSLNIFLNPKDARMLDSSWVDQQMLITGGQAKIIPSGNITRGGCYVKGNMGTVDGRVETQLDAFLKNFDEASKLAE